jgi:hypothetical protein
MRLVRRRKGFGDQTIFSEHVQLAGNATVAENAPTFVFVVLRSI